MKIRLQKSIRRRTLTGTLGGFSEHFKIDYTWLRLIFVILVIVTKGLFSFVYLLATIVMPQPNGYRGNNLFINLARSIYSNLRMMFSDLIFVVFNSRYRKLFGGVLFGAALLWYKSPMPVPVGILIVLVTVVLFDPFGLTKDRPKTYSPDSFISLPTLQASLEREWWETPLEKKSHLPQA